jgi:hypothetical protein
VAARGEVDAGVMAGGASGAGSGRKKRVRWGMDGWWLAREHVTPNGIGAIGPMDAGKKKSTGL